MMSVSLPCASIVMLPAEVAIVTAASPVDISSAALDTLVQDKVPEPSVVRANPEVPSAVGNTYATEAVLLPALNPV